MRNWRLGLSLVVALAGSGLVLSAQHDLDALSPQELAQELEEELDDLFEELGLDEDEQYEDEYLLEEILIALSDQGDDDDESDITSDDLEDEMAEASTTLQAVITSAVQAADQMSRRERSPSNNIVLAKFSGDSSLFTFRNAGLYPPSQKGNQRGWAVAGVAKRQAATGLANAIRRAR